jgi:hypothetical protein
LTEGRRKRNANSHRAATAIAMITIISLAMLFPLLNPNLIPVVKAAQDDAYAAPTKHWGPFFTTSGDVQIDVNRTGIAVRVEIPREFLAGVITTENDTHFVTSDIRSDYYYYSVVDESRHWSYKWNGTDSDAPCYKPNFSIYDPNAPWCVEIWNYLNGSFNAFTPPKFVRFTDLNAPTVAGMYNFTLFVADHTNALGLPDFVNAWNKTFYVPVSMNDDPATISGSICDGYNFTNAPYVCDQIRAKGVVYARNIDTQQVARAYVNQTTGEFNITGLAPGTYQLQGSAGIFRGLAYSLTSTDCSVLGDPGCFVMARGGKVSTQFGLERAPQVCGRIEYWEPFGLAPLAHSVSDHPYLNNVGIKTLNITVEATDHSGHVFRYQNVSLDTSSDTFRILTGSGVKYTDLDPYGTEFAGLPSLDDGPYTMTINVRITGYLQRVAETVNVGTGPGPATPYLCNTVSPSPVIMDTGGVMTGQIQLVSSPPAPMVHLETPEEAELALGFVPTDALFGGNILIRAYDHSGYLRGVTVLNGTLPDGRTCYASPALSPLCRIKLIGPATIQFYVIGFSEYYNRTWAGTWGVEDYGLPDDSGYELNVQIRGYEQYDNPTLPISLGSNQSVTIRMVRGGAIAIGVYSYDNMPGTRALQALFSFRFLKGLTGGFTIPARIRVYFYDSSHVSVGYIERLEALGVPNGVDTEYFFKGVFAGQNWSLREIWFYGFEPTHLTTGTYSVEGYTLGYVQQQPVSTYVELAGYAVALLALLLGNEIDMTVPVFSGQSLLGPLPEHDHARSEAYLSGATLSGATVGNFSKGVPTLSLPIFGFGGMVQGGLLNGQGHFFYVAPDGTRYFDYGLDTGTYTAQIPEFGFIRHFMPLTSLDATFNDLFLEEGLILHVIAMARIISSFIPVQGWVASSVDGVMPLSWVMVEANNGTVSRSAPTLDGFYDNQGAINVPAGTYNVTFSVAFYEPQTSPNVHVQWGGDYPVLVPEGYLCPIADPSMCSTASPAPPLSSTGNAPANLFLRNLAQTVPFSAMLIATALVVSAERRKD